MQRRFLEVCVVALFLLGVTLPRQARSASSPQAEPRQTEPAPDNTGVNKRDQSPNEPTADQQKENPADRSISQKIRESMTADKSLSTYAHNVKVITQNGEVTLKGPVNSAAEKKGIEAKAATIVGSGHVKSEIEVVPPQINNKKP